MTRDVGKFLNCFNVLLSRPRSSVWLEHWTLNPGVAGSTPVGAILKMKFNPRLKQDVEKFKDYVILVEGKKDVSTLKHAGFENVYAIHKTGVCLRERIEQIADKIENKKRTKVCILTDLDKQGKKLYMLIKPILIELGVKVDSSFRGLLIKAKMSHMEGIGNFMKNVEGI